MSALIGQPFPVLRQDGSSLDWQDARYRVEIEVRGQTAEITHDLANASELEQLIDAGAAAWAVEVRCPRTLLARTWSGPDSTQRIEWNGADMSGEVFFFPGLLAIRAALLSTAGLSDLWGEEPVPVPAGAWLVRGDAFASRNLAASLIEFLKDDSLEEGRLKAHASGSEEKPRFVVSVAPDLFSRASTGDRDIHVAGLIAALAKLRPDSPGFRAEAESRIASLLRDALEQAGTPAWDSDDWDPAWAATTIERFHPARHGEEEAW